MYIHVCTGVQLGVVDFHCPWVHVHIRGCAISLYNGPFRKLSRAMLVTSFGGQCRKKTAIFYECEGFSRRLRVQKRAL